MQYHLNGFKGSENPLKLQFEGEREPDFQTSLPSEVDVFIVGAGPAGQLLGAQLAQFPDITTRIIETRPGRLENGQADGLQCRTVEIFQAFGFCQQVLREGYWVNESTFCSPGANNVGLKRTGRVPDTEHELSEFPHIILNQARMHDLWLETMKWSPTRLEPSYNRSLIGFNIPNSDGPVEVEVDHNGTREIIKAKYLVGADGSRSVVRKKLGLEMKGDFANQAWGVLDCLAVTDFPDVRLKCSIHSAEAGSILIVPREGGYLVRFYIELDKLQPNERVLSLGITSDVLIKRAQAILKPFTFEVKHIAYWSVYEVGQRLTDRFHDVPPGKDRNPRVFIAGDACHTHSAKAGQGMNVSMADAFNLGWKLAAVLHGTTDPTLLRTYDQERQTVAQTLINFDRRFSRMFAAKPKAKNKSDNDQVPNGQSNLEYVDPAVFQDFYVQQGRFTAGLQTEYPSGLITSSDKSHQYLASGLKIGERFHSAQVLRLADAKPIHLAHVMVADGRFRLVIFGPNTCDPRFKDSPFFHLCTFLDQELIPTFTPKGHDIDSVIDVRAVIPQSRTSVELQTLPSILRPKKGKFGMVDYEKVFTDEPSYNFGGGGFYRKRHINAEEGCAVVVRPDQHVAGIWPLDERDALKGYFGGFLKVQN
ncbi:m-hydroxybenzoate hydroxylase [Piedraia hortae CBS 480.64]|uniref:M-hydroxybenzoate hydroxylase n=1 Tax=Piedraia hortae CBS 480.64 TaxID=1314780 RepID=A0A6A7BZH6_9PEZI|nr:m-hydroxybenzoate hydroxylase [Piedraia hortae CBS 480.64]